MCFRKSPNLKGYDVPLNTNKCINHTLYGTLISKTQKSSIIPFYMSSTFQPNESHKFTPKLISIYQKIKQNLTQQEFNDDQEDFEIIYVSSDHNSLEFDSSFGAMPWLALPFDDSVSKDLTNYFDIRGIPGLIIVGPDGKTITKNGRSLINVYEEEAYPFTEARVDLLEKQMDEDANNLPSMELHSGHRHELTLVSRGNGGGPFICCDCDEQGSGWAYQCIDCGYEVHTKCLRPVVQVSNA